MKINYVTGNKIKVDYANKKLNQFGIEIEQIILDVPEIQSSEKFAVAEDKAKKAFEIKRKPLFVTDHFWEIQGLNGFPGAFMKYVNKWLTASDFLNLMNDKKERKVICTDTLCYIDENGIKYFTDELVGEFADKQDGDYDPNLSSTIDTLVKFNGKYFSQHQKEKWSDLGHENKMWQELAEFLKTKNI